MERSIAALDSWRPGVYHIAARNDRVGGWTRDDIEEARPQANELGCLRGYHGPTPDEA